MNSSATPTALLLNLNTLQVGGPQGWVDVSDADCALLQAFAQNPKQRIGTPEMLARIGKAADDAAKRALEVQIVRLRKKLQQAGAPEPTIKAIRGVGYQLCVAVAMAQSAV